MSINNSFKKNKKYEKSLKDPHIVTWRQLLLLVENLYAGLEKKLLEKDCTYPRFRLLFLLYFEAPCSPAFLAKRLHASRSNLTTFIRRLEDDELIYPCPRVSTKTRLKYVLSEKGIKNTEELMSFHFGNVKKLSIFAQPQLISELKKFLKENKNNESI